MNLRLNWNRIGLIGAAIVVGSNVGISVLIGVCYEDHKTLLVSSSCLYGLCDLEMFYSAYSIRNNMQLLASNEYFPRTLTIKLAVFEIGGKWSRILFQGKLFFVVVVWSNWKSRGVSCSWPSFSWESVPSQFHTGALGKTRLEIFFSFVFARPW